MESTRSVVASLKAGNFLSSVDIQDAYPYIPITTMLPAFCYGRRAVLVWHCHLGSYLHHSCSKSACPTFGISMNSGNSCHRLPSWPLAAGLLSHGLVWQCSKESPVPSNCLLDHQFSAFKSSLPELRSNLGHRPSRNHPLSGKILPNSPVTLSLNSLLHKDAGYHGGLLRGILGVDYWQSEFASCQCLNPGRAVSFIIFSKDGKKQMWLYHSLPYLWPRPGIF